MPLDVPAVQASLRAQGLDGWLLYDFHGSNPIASRLAGLGPHVMTTRRWYYLVPAAGEPVALVHAIERHNLDALPGRKTVYAERSELERGLRELVQGRRRLAMEYSPDCAIPYVSRVDGGTLELVRELGAEVVSSGDLIQQFEAVWSDAALSSHRAASEKLYRVKDRAFEQIGRRISDRVPTTEYDIQQMMTGWFADEGLVSDSLPVVAAEENAGNPHYLPTSTRHRVIDRNELVLLDLWGKLQGDGTVFADITWVGFTGQTVPERFSRAFTAVREARDAAIQLVETVARNRGDVRGWQVDRAARDVLNRAGYGDHFIHRTGHSLGDSVHGNGVHMDDYETHDDRRLLPGTGFTIEPGVYFDDFGVRSEVNMYFDEDRAVVTGPAQRDIVTLAS